ncbi:MAG: hypothetical protein WAU88_16710 [Candidatus Zixiibacteriota bacterium]
MLESRTPEKKQRRRGSSHSGKARSGQSESGIRLTGQLINFVMIALTIAAGYFMTIQSLRLELAGKAENVTVETLDKKLGNLEVLFREGGISKEEFFRFSRDVESRLARIEYHVSGTTGVNREGK